MRLLNLPTTLALAGFAALSLAARAQDTSPPAASDTTVPAPTPATTPAAAPAAADTSASPAITVNGFVDWYYEANFNRPPKSVSDGEGGTVAVPVQNNLRNFDFKANEFALNMAEVVVQRAPAPIGFHINLAFGKATDWIHAAEPGGADTYKNILQAYLTAPVKLLGKGDTVDVGKFVTSQGYEVIETKDNWNYTRSLLFAWAIPYYHAGIRYNHPINATSSLTLHLVNGWNDVEDNNSAPSYGFMYTNSLSKKLTWVQNYMGGPELANDNRDWRHMVDTVLTYNASDTLSLALNADYGYQKLPDGKATWDGIAAYARQQVTPKTAIAARAEIFDDHDGFSTGTKQKVWEGTLTYEWKTGANLLTRAEARYDKSDAPVFLEHGGGTKTSQATLLLGTVAMF